MINGLKKQRSSRKSETQRTLSVRLVTAVNEGNARLDEVTDRLDYVFVNISLHVCNDVSAESHTERKWVVTRRAVKVCVCAGVRNFRPNYYL